MTFHAGEGATDGRTQNVSRGGLCASVDEALVLGSELDISLVLMFEDDVQSEPLRIPARVVWSTMVDDTHQVGIMFRALSAEQTQYLNIFLKYLDTQRAEQRPRDLSVDDRFR